MRDKLEKAIRLAKRTGDKLIVFDQLRSDDPVVVMSLDAYEELLEQTDEFSGLTDDDPLDRINPDITDWRNDIPEDFLDFDEISDGSEGFPAPEDGEAGNLAPKRKWSIPETRKSAAEEVIEEDRQYLEDVNF